MKTLSIASLAILLLLAGCKKESTNKNPTVYLLSKATYVVTHVDNSKSTLVDTYTYDAQKRLIALNSQFAGINFQYTYDDHNHLVAATWTQINGAPISASYYSYQGNTVKDSSVSQQGGTNVTLLTLNTNGQVQSADVNNAASSSTYTYDSRGNVTGYNAAGGFKYTYTYDDKQNPLSMTGAKNIDLMYFFTDVPLTYVNNLLTGNSGETTYAYTYNSAGFPVTANVQVNDPMVPISYTVAYEYFTN